MQLHGGTFRFVYGAVFSLLAAIAPSAYSLPDATSTFTCGTCTANDALFDYETSGTPYYLVTESATKIAFTYQVGSSRAIVSFDRATYNSNPADQATIHQCTDLFWKFASARENTLFIRVSRSGSTITSFSCALHVRQELAFAPNTTNGVYSGAGGTTTTPTPTATP